MLYSYVCQKCGEEVDIQKPVSEYDRPESCPACDNKEMTRVIGKTGFVLKGGGWYKSDYKGERHD